MCSEVHMGSGCADEIFCSPGCPPLKMTFSALPSSKSLRPASILCSNGGDGVPSLCVSLWVTFRCLASLASSFPRKAYSTGLL